MRRYIVVLLFAVLNSPLAHGAVPVCALLDPEKTPQGALLEAKLLADDSATWVDRADIDRVLKEQKLQAMFSPQGVGERVRFGKLLKADLLVMVRLVKGTAQATLEVVMSETTSGMDFWFAGRGHKKRGHSAFVQPKEAKRNEFHF